MLGRHVSLSPPLPILACGDFRANCVPSLIPPGALPTHPHPLYPPAAGPQYPLPTCPLVHSSSPPFPLLLVMPPTWYSKAMLVSIIILDCLVLP